MDLEIDLQRCYVGCLLLSKGCHTHYRMPELFISLSSLILSMYRLEIKHKGLHGFRNRALMSRLQLLSVATYL